MSFSTLKPGTVLEDRWRIEQKVGQGGMGAVYLARELALDRRVAVKVFWDPAGLHPEALERFDREMKLLASIDDPHVVPIYASGRIDGYPFLVMKALSGSTLRAVYLKSRPMNWSSLAPILRQVCVAVDHLHQEGIVHRDLKPSNIFVSPTGHVSLLDFGIARRKADAPLTQTGMVVGTADYMSPEQVRGDEVDGKADVYAIASMTFELLSGRAPFKEASHFELLRSHLEKPPPPISTFNPDLPPELDAVLIRGMEKSPARRQDTARRLWAEIDLCFGGSGTGEIYRDPPASGLSPRPPSRSMPALAPPAPEPRTELGEAAGLTRADAPRARTTRSASVVRSTLIRAGLIVAAALVVGLGAWGWLRPQGGPRDAGVADAGAQAADAATPTPLPPPPAEPDAAVAAATISTPDASSPGKGPQGGGGGSGVLSVHVAPWGQVFVDGKLIESKNMLDAIVEVKSGRHKVRVVNDAFPAWEKSVVVPAGRTKQLTVDLRSGRAND